MTGIRLLSRRIAYCVGLAAADPWQLSVQDRYGVDLDQQLGLAQSHDRDQGDLLDRVHPEPRRCPPQTLTERGHLVAAPVHDVQRQLRDVLETTADGGQSGGDVHVGLLDLRREISLPRPPSPAIRTALVERAAELLSRRQPVTLRKLVQGTGVSTMAVYTYFDGMPGLWRAVRQEGFTRLADRLAAVELSEDPVRDLAALGAAYTSNAIENPALYRAMFDTAAELEDPDAAASSFQILVAAAERACAEGRFVDSCVAEAVALRQWASGHGLTMLVLTGVLPREALDDHAPDIIAALFIDAGDDATRCRASVTAGWATLQQSSSNRSR